MCTPRAPGAARTQPRSRRKAGRTSGRRSPKSAASNSAMILLSMSSLCSMRSTRMGVIAIGVADFFISRSTAEASAGRDGGISFVSETPSRRSARRIQARGGGCHGGPPSRFALRRTSRAPADSLRVACQPELTLRRVTRERRLAERVGFEPTVEFPLHTLSKRAPSTTRTSLHLESITCGFWIEPKVICAPDCALTLSASPHILTATRCPCHRRPRRAGAPRHSGTRIPEGLNDLLPSPAEHSVRDRRSLV
jgi:hypothetical protein